MEAIKMGIGPMVTTWEEWTNVFQDLEVWRETIHAILSMEGISYNKIENGYPGTSVVFIVDNRYVLKIYPGQFIKDHEREWPVLRLLNRHKQPLLIASGYFKDDTEIWPYALLRFIDGTAYREVSRLLTDFEKNEFIDRLVKAINNIHGLPFETLRDYSAYRWDISEEDISTQVEKLCKLPFFNQDNFKADLYDFIKRGKKLLEQEPLVFVHGDLTQDHLFFRKENGKWHFTDIIDWGDAHIAPALYDFVVLWADVFSDQVNEWKNLIGLYDKGYDVKDSHFQSLFASMLFLHPFADGLIRHAYNNKAKGNQPASFQTVTAFIQWIFNE
jgi:aminoglycoside phosphotransferase (APT) family kinase protein